MRFCLHLSLLGVLAIGIPGTSIGDERPAALIAAADAAKPIAERLALLRAAIQENEAAMARRKEGMDQIREKLRTHQRETIELQTSLIGQDEELRVLQKEIDEKELEVVRLRQALYDRVAKQPLVVERSEVQRTLANEFIAEEAKQQESINQTTQLNSALMGLEALQTEKEGKADDARSDAK